MTVFGAPFPLKPHPRGFFRTQRGLEQVKSDLLILLLTNPGERVMLPAFGTPLNSLLFEQNDPIIAEQARNMIINSINTWEPRIVIQNLEVTIGDDIPKESLNAFQDPNEAGNILLVQIEFSDFDNIKDIQNLRLEVALGNGNVGGINAGTPQII